MQLDLALAVQVFVTLLVIMSPLGNVPVFLALTAGEDGKARRRTATHALLAAAGLIYLFAFFGTRILAALSIGLPALQASGGVVLFLVALQMLRGDALVPTTAEGVSVAVVPLGVPILAGPGAISAVMVFMTSGDGGELQLATQLSVGARDRRRPRRHLARPALRGRRRAAAATQRHPPRDPGDGDAAGGHLDRAGRHRRPGLRAGASALP
jgi:MarC family membrane protein